MNFPIPTPARKSRWPDLTRGSLPWALAQNLPENALKVILTQDTEQALRLQTAWQFFRPQDNAVFLPDWETLPYERFSPHQDLVSERLSALWQVKSGQADVLVLPVATAMQKLAPPAFLLGRTFWLKTGQTLDAEALRGNLVDAGYSHVSNVVAAGEFAVRGGILDIFPMGTELPYRLDLFGDEIDSIKTFDPDTQRTIAPVSEIRLLPAHEFPTDDDAQKIFRARFREEIESDPNAAAVYKAVSNGHFGAGVEYYLPLFFEDECATLFDYLGGDVLAVCIGDVHAEARRFEADVKTRFKMAQGDASYPPLHPQHLYLTADQFAGRLKPYGQILPDLNGQTHLLPDVAVNRQSDEPLAALKRFQTGFAGRILLTAESAGRRETMLGFFAQHGLKPKSVDGWQAFLDSDAPLAITVTPLAYGFQTGTVGRAFIPDNGGVSQTPTPSENTLSDGLDPRRVGVNPPLSETGEAVGLHPPYEAEKKLSGSLKTERPSENTYSDGTPICIGDTVRVGNVWHGRIVAVFAQNQYAPHFSVDEWHDLKTGVMAEFDEAGLVYYADEELADELVLVARADKAVGLHPPYETSVGRAFMPDNGGTSQTPSGINARPTQPLAVITETDLYQYVARSRTSVRRKKHAQVSDGLLRDLAEINIGDPVVHEEHGIGRYMGLVTMDLGGETAEMMLLEYAGEAQLYVPVSQLHLISRYSGQAHENVQLHKLGSGAWSKAKRKAAEKARDTAAELLNLYAQRAAQEGFKFAFNEQDYQAFADGFGYEETEDQAAAIGAVLKDLTQGKPMDRLVCGDVGFGKTEVALRAAFVAVMGGKQVAVLAPTTLLVEQHAQNFADRFADFPVKVASLSRFNSGKTTTATLKGMAEGTVDIVIGTHKLVQDDIQFKNLGLVIIDEEHRFGVRQKEQLKRLRANVDILTLTATPIPRTLSMALEGLRDFSLITTAPSRRLAVKTFVKPFSEGSVREAVLRELKRGGQVFFLHNEVETIENMRERLETLLPEARIGVAHGQLRERELEQVMRDFLQQRFNVLLCSTIIETGIDIPNANTIIINRADKFGLAQLHQLRGRVGRSHHQAYAYLLTPEYITKDAEKRLDAIAAADELGAGFTLAMQDLEIRGAGEILGE
ncbi:transcription-repair coupling factor, partial [Neisseria sp.]